MCLHLVLIPPDYLLCPSRPVTIPEPFPRHVINAGTSCVARILYTLNVYILYHIILKSLKVPVYDAMYMTKCDLVG